MCSAALGLNDVICHVEGHLCCGSHKLQVSLASQRGRSPFHSPLGQVKTQPCTCTRCFLATRPCRCHHSGQTSRLHHVPVLRLGFSLHRQCLHRRLLRQCGQASPLHNGLRSLLHLPFHPPQPHQLPLKPSRTFDTRPAVASKWKMMKQAFLRLQAVGWLSYV